jgi:hypothetical protein
VKEPNARLQQRVNEALDLAAKHKLPKDISKRILGVWDSINENPGQSGPRKMAWPELDAIAGEAPSSSMQSVRSNEILASVVRASPRGPRRHLAPEGTSVAARPLRQGPVGAVPQARWQTVTRRIPPRQPASRAPHVSRLVL